MNLKQHRRKLKKHFLVFIHISGPEEEILAKVGHVYDWQPYESHGELVLSYHHEL